MKILNTNKPSRKELLDKTYTCELSGWEIAAVTALINKFGGGDPSQSLREYTDSVTAEGSKLFPFVTGDLLFDSRRYFSDDSKQKLLEE